MKKIVLKYIGEDYWGRCLFKGSNGKFYKTTALNPRTDFPNVSAKEQHMILKSLHASCPPDDPGGEPDYPCNLERFTLEVE